MTDIVEWLKKVPVDDKQWGKCITASNEIKRLRKQKQSDDAEIDRLVEALLKIFNHQSDLRHDGYVYDVAKNALSLKTQKRGNDD